MVPAVVTARSYELVLSFTKARAVKDGTREDAGSREGLGTRQQLGSYEVNGALLCFDSLPWVWHSQ